MKVEFTYLPESCDDDGPLWSKEGMVGVRGGKYLLVQPLHTQTHGYEQS